MPASPAKAPASTQNPRISRPTGSPCTWAARTLPPAMRAAKPQVVRSISTHASHAAHHAHCKPPMHVHPRHVAHAQIGRQRGGRGLVQTGRIAQRPFDQMVHQRDGDIRQQQRRYRLVHAAIVTQAPREADPKSANQHRPRRHDGQRHRGPASRSARRPVPPPRPRPTRSRPRLRSPQGQAAQAAPRKAPRTAGVRSATGYSARKMPTRTPRSRPE
jgi:hypothetical protein